MGVIDKGAAIATVEDLLANLENAAGTLADRMDTPPLSIKDLRASVDAVRESLKAPDMKNLVSADAIVPSHRSALDVTTVVPVTRLTVPKIVMRSLAEMVMSDKIAFQ